MIEYGFAFLTLLGQVATASSSQPVPSFDAVSFAQLSANDRAEVVLAVLRWREHQLDEFSYELTEYISFVKQREKPQTPFLKNVVELKRLGSKNLIHIATFNQAGEQEVEFWSSWDGSIRRSQQLRPKRTPTGTIADTEIENVRMTYYNDVLGYRSSDSGTPMTRVEWLQQWLEEMKKYDARIEATVEPIDGLPHLKVNLIARPNVKHEFWLDPQRDFMLVREEYVDRDDARNDFGFRRSEVTSSQDANGLWIPTEVLQTRSVTNKDDNQTEHRFTVSKFERTNVSEEELRVVFPTGTAVFDSIRNAAFRVTEGGSESPLGVYDANTGLATVGGQNADDVFRSATEPFNSTNRWGRTLIITAAVVLATFALLFILYRRRRLAQG